MKVNPHSPTAAAATQNLERRLQDKRYVWLSPISKILPLRIQDPSFNSKPLRLSMPNGIRRIKAEKEEDKPQLMNTTLRFRWTRGNVRTTASAKAGQRKMVQLKSTLCSHVGNVVTAAGRLEIPAAGKIVKQNQANCNNKTPGEEEGVTHNRCKSDGIGKVPRVAQKLHIVESHNKVLKKTLERARLEELERLKKEVPKPAPIIPLLQPQGEPKPLPLSRPSGKETTKTTISEHSGSSNNTNKKQPKSEKRPEPPKKRLEEEAPAHPICISGKEASLEGYIIGRLIGQGAYASVRLAYHKGLNKKTALKVYEKKKLVEPQRQKSVYREIKLLEKMSHPNVVKLYDAFDTDNHVILAMEYVRGHSLHSYLKAQPNRILEEWEAKRLFQQVVCGIEYCHGKSIAHRDIKLENLLLDEHNNVKIIDFGFSTCIPNTRKIKIFCGTPSYMSPEIVLRKEYAGPPADVWALGVLLYAMLCGSFPFKGRNDKELYRRISSCQVIYPEHLSVLGKALLQKIFQLDPEKRLTAKEIAADPWLSAEEQDPLFQPKVAKEASGERPGINLEAYMAYYSDQAYMVRNEGTELLPHGVRMVTNNVGMCGTVNNNISIINNITHINFPPQNGSLTYSNQSFSSKGGSLIKSSNNSNAVFGSETSKTGSVADSELLSSIVKLGYSIDEVKQQLQNENSHIYKLYNKLLGERKQLNAGIAPQVVPSITSSSFEAFKSKSRLGNLNTSGQKLSESNDMLNQTAPLLREGGNLGEIPRVEPQELA